MDFTATIRKQFLGDRAAPAVEFEGQWYTRGELADYAGGIAALLKQAGVPGNSAVGIIVRNRLPHAAAILGLVAANRSFSMIYAFQSPEAMARDVAKLQLAAVVADREDWTAPVIEAARAAGSLGIAIAITGERVALVPQLSTLGAGPFRVAPAEPGIEVLTSGTTGAPKRIQIRMPVLERAVSSATAQVMPNAGEPPDLVFWPFGGIGGVCQLLGATYVGKRMVLLEKFNVADWVSAIKRYRITKVGVQPTVIRMVLEAKVPKEDLASLVFIFGGSAPLEPATQQLFEQTYGLPVVWGYGATEFAGTIIAWTPDLYQQHGEAKRGSIGKAFPGVQIRAVDPVSGVEVATAEQGYLEALVPLVNPDWIRTTDIASIDAEGFVTLHGRGDGAIIRGGFKVLPETVVKTLIRHPAVLDAAVVGLPEPRLGEIPVAVVELRADVAVPSETELKNFLREHLPSHHVPAQIRIVERLPRTPSLKVSLGAVREMFADSPGQ
ncbi:MAG: AMP-dependent synthetase and ligase [Hydrocarboniphaga sp.]|uniref:class I adenylate-forming enzyme family protein n=1 Tax=Hydrocarboniphaga sp. TaxID=2033016 RepID=UPI002624A263|nr:class I adenylate-forming enzyme family protein [Hydrocarboniphaga sp.]MDB5971439.1 AMP-dependent synthetase and ligase [Hydrocarboniphaga sp.]